MNRKESSGTEQGVQTKRVPLLLLGFVASLLTTVGLMIFMIFRILALINADNVAGVAQTAFSPRTFVVPLLLVIFGASTLWFQYRLGVLATRLKADRSRFEALQMLNAAQHNLKGSVPSLPGQFGETLRALANRSVDIELLVGDEASFQAIAQAPNVEVRLTDRKLGYFIIDYKATISGPGLEVTEENSPHFYINTADTPKALAELHRVVKAFDNAFDRSAAPTTSDLTQPGTP